MTGQPDKKIRALARVHVASLAGGALSSVAAGGASLLAARHAWQIWVPLAFCVVLLVVAMALGTRAGVLGTLLAALVFAVFLFRPLGSVRVDEAVARANLGWMLVIGLTFSFLFARPAAGVRRRSSGAETTEPGKRAS
jgi:K+-sensing histidine kinase KdpD